MRSRRSCLGATETILLVISVGVASPLNAQGLPDGTVRSWNAYVGLTEDRIGGEIHSQGHAFLVQDFQDPESARNDRRDLLAGKVIISEMATRDGNGRQLDVEGGRVHHWRGAILIPGATLEEVLRNVQNPDAAEGQQEDVLETRVLDRGQGWLRVYLKLVRSKIVTVTYNSEHLVHYRLHGTGRASSQTVATKIAELADAGTPAEHEKHQNEDRGFLWRLNTYWRYEEVDQGVLVECESVSLSRSIPLLVRPFVNPIVNGIAKESLHRTLSAMRERMRRPARLE